MVHTKLLEIVMKLKIEIISRISYYIGLTLNKRWKVNM